MERIIKLKPEDKEKLEEMAEKLKVSIEYTENNGRLTAIISGGIGNTVYCIPEKEGIFDPSARPPTFI